MSVLKLVLFLTTIHGTEVEMECEFYETVWHNVTGTACVAKNMVVTEPDSYVKMINGQGGIYFHTYNVRVVKMDNQTVHYIPKGIELLFPGIMGISIGESNLQSITKEDLKPFDALEIIWLYGNNLHKLDGDLFEYNSQLKAINFGGNELTFIGEKILTPLKNLEQAYFGRANCIDMYAMRKDELPDMIAEVQAKCGITALIDEISNLKVMLKACDDKLDSATKNLFTYSKRAKRDVSYSKFYEKPGAGQGSNNEVSFDDVSRFF